MPRLVWFIWLICNFRLTLTLQGKWRLADGSQTPRNILMRVLSNVNAIYIRAFYGNGGPIPATLRYKFKKSNLLYNRLLSVLVLCRLGDLWFLFSMTSYLCTVRTAYIQAYVLSILGIPVRYVELVICALRMAAVE